MDPQTVKLLKKFLIVPIDHYENVVTCLDLAAIPDLIAQLPYNARRGLAKDIASAAAKYSHKVDSVDQVNKLFTLLAPLIQDEQDQPTFEDIYADEVPCLAWLALLPVWLLGPCNTKIDCWHGNTCHQSQKPFTISQKADQEHSCQVWHRENEIFRHEPEN